jgi:hypothetical protein
MVIPRGRAVGERRILGRFVVMDPAMRGGEPSFRQARA